MPLEFVLLAPVSLSVEDQREFAELVNPPLVARQVHDGGAMAFSELDDSLVLTISRARRVGTQSDVRRALAAEGDGGVPEDTAVWYEGVIPFRGHERGLMLLMVFEEAIGGKAIVRGVTLREGAV